MRHNIDGRKFGRNTSHRLAMFRNMANCVIEKEQIITTIHKAKEAKRVVDRLITLGKTGTAHARRLAFDRTRSDDVVKKLFTALAERYKTRAGGYTRVLRLSDRRWGDAAEMAVLELVDHPVIDRKKKQKGEKKAETEKESSESQQTKETGGRFKKMFAGKSKVSGGKAGKAGQARSSGAARKTPAASGSNKSGGSSS